MQKRSNNKQLHSLIKVQDLRSVTRHEMTSSGRVVAENVDMDPGRALTNYFTSSHT